jgi:hypothetical protein
MYSDSASGFIDNGGRRFYVSSRDDDGWGTYVFAHHKGLQGATDLLRGTLDETRASRLLTQQAARQADVWRQQYNSAQDAYRAWLFDYANRQVQPNLYRVR